MSIMEDSFAEEDFDQMIEKLEAYENKFFAPSKSLSHHVLSFQLFERRKSNVEKSEINLTFGNKIPCAKYLITSENALIESNFNDKLDEDGLYQTGYERQISDPKFTNMETLLVGNTKILYRQRVKNHRNHKGNYYLENIGNYEDMCRKLRRISENQLEITKLMIDFSSKGSYVDLAKLKAINENANQDDVDFLNNFFFHISTKEVTRYYKPHDEKARLPLAFAQAAAIHLLLIGKLRFEEVFGSDSDYGVFTGTSILARNLEKTRYKVKKIFKKYGFNFDPESLLTFFYGC